MSVPQPTQPLDLHPPVGIDLGTTYSVIAFLDASGRPTTIGNDSGEFLTPSAVAFDTDTVLVGKEAVKSAIFEPAVFADCFKRDMGRREFRRRVANIQVPPEVFSGFVLRQLKRDAERHLGMPVTKAVITVPAFFDETRRKATQEAGRLAGLQVLDIINEPTAAAVAFGYYRSVLEPSAEPAHGQRILVYDLGGGTFDVTVLEIFGRTFRTLATDGDVQLGGHDFDERLVNHVAEAFQRAHHVDLRSDPHDAAQLWQDVRDAKHTLSQRATAIVLCSHAGTRMKVEISRADFAGMTADLLDRTATTTELVLRQSKLSWDQIDRVLLVGGATRMPMVGDMLTRVTGRDPDRSISADEAVAHGAALYAGLFIPEGRTLTENDFTLVNVNSHSLGIIGTDRRSKQKRNAILIPKNSPLPCRAVRRFSSARDNQSSVKVVVVEGESERPEHCIQLGECVVRNLPPGLPRGTKIEVEYRYSHNGRLAVRARVPAARQSASVEIRYDRALHIPVLDTWHRRVCGLPDLHPQAASQQSAEDFERTACRVDELLTTYGQKAVQLTLSPVFADCQIAAQNAGKQLKLATKRFVECEKKRQAAVGQAETLAAHANLANASIAMEQAERATRVAHRTLGYACVTAEFAPASLSELYNEIKKLRAV